MQLVVLSDRKSWACAVDIETNGPLLQIDKLYIQRIWTFTLMNLCFWCTWNHHMFFTADSWVFFFNLFFFYRCVCEQSGVDTEPNGTRTESGEFKRLLSQIHIQICFTGIIIIRGFNEIMKEYKSNALMPSQGIVGNLASGKSALVHRYLTGTYVQEESPEGKNIILSVCLYKIWLDLFTQCSKNKNPRHSGTSIDIQPNWQCPALPIYEINRKSKVR